MSYIELKNVSKGFGSGTARSEVLGNINLDIEEGEFVALVGYSGSGKTTFMNLLAGLEMPDQGEVVVAGEKVTGPHPDRGLVFQNYSLLPWLSVQGNVEMATNQVYRNESREEKLTRVKKVVDQVNLTPALGKRPGELSGGMRQRNSVARTLSMNPKVLLLDEPLSALDALTRGVIQDQILDIWKKENQTIVLITNDVDEGLYMADRIIPISLDTPATLGPECVVDLPRPRDRGEIQRNPEFVKRRNELIHFLLEQKRKSEAAAEAVSIALPNIRPMDISQAKPSPYRGLRPRRKRKIS